ncbi:MAG: hypothetical protein JWO05_3858 [Gemmatimonadetes bacterium]|nr:hypothetical protein [Gemmatimonadota bacterium]
MARLEMITATDPAVLLRHAASGFLVPMKASDENPFPTIPYLLAVRQGGLRDDVYSLATAAGSKGWFDLPLCIFHELHDRLGAPSRTVLGDRERLVMLHAAIRSAGSNVFAKLDRPEDFLEAVDRLFGELVSEDVSPERFSSALASRADRDNFEQLRDDDLSRSYAAYRAALAQHDIGDGRDGWLHAARAIDAGTADLSTMHRGHRELRIFGLQDLRHGWSHLIAALGRTTQLDRVTLHSSTALELGAIPHERVVLEEPESVATRLFSQASSRAKPVILSEAKDLQLGRPRLLSAPDNERELQWISLECRRLIDAGTAPHRIAIVARQSRPGVDRAVSALARVGVPATARQRTAICEIPVIRALQSLLGAAGEGWTRHGLSEVADNPYLGAGLSTQVLNFLGFRRRIIGLSAWQKSLDALAVQEASPNQRDRLPSPELVAETREAFAQFSERARELDKGRTLPEWLEWLAAMMERDDWELRKRAFTVEGERYDLLRLDATGCEALQGVIDEWRSAVTKYADDEMRSSRLSVGEFASQLSACLRGEVALWTPMFRGVQVLESLAAAYRSFEHVFVIGMEAGAFPVRASQSPIFDDRERSALVAAGIPLELRGVWDARERELFRILVAGARQLTLSHARCDEQGSEVIASAFVDELLDACDVEKVSVATSDVVLKGVPLYKAVILSSPAVILSEARDLPLQLPLPSALDHAQHAARVERMRHLGQPSPWSGTIEDPELVAMLAEQFGDDYLWSPTQLEEFAKCPWAFFSKRLLGLELLEDPEEDIAPSAQGTILHVALERFYNEAMKRDGKPVFLREPDLAWALPLAEQCVDAAFAAEMERQWVGHPAMHAAKQGELRRIMTGFIAWEVALHEEMHEDNNRKKAPKLIRTGVESHELRFDDMRYVKDGVTLRYRGTIDRVEVSVDDRLPGVPFIGALDYKTSKYATPGGGEAKAWADGVVLQVPLYAYALSQLRPDHEVVRVGYASLKRPASIHQLELYQFDRKTGEADPDDKAQEKWKDALNAAVMQLKRARAGEFPADPPPSCHCPPWCHGRDVCRVKGGPRDAF